MAPEGAHRGRTRVGRGKSSVLVKGQHGDRANHNPISTLRFAVARLPEVFLKFYTPNERIVTLETLKEERLSITLFKDSNVTICFFCTQKHKKTGGKQTHANRNVERGYDLHPASRLSSKSGDLLRTHENKHLLASGLVACDRRHLWVDVKSDLRAPVAYTFM